MMLQVNTSVRDVRRVQSNSASRTDPKQSIGEGHVAKSAELRILNYAAGGKSPEADAHHAADLGQLVRDAGSVVEALAALPVDEAADAALGRLFREYAPKPLLRRPLPKKVR